MRVQEGYFAYKEIELVEDETIPDGYALVLSYKKIYPCGVYLHTYADQPQAVEYTCFWRGSTGGFSEEPIGYVNTRAGRERAIQLIHHARERALGARRE